MYQYIAFVVETCIETIEWNELTDVRQSCSYSIIFYNNKAPVTVPRRKQNIETT